MKKLLILTSSATFGLLAFPAHALDLDMWGKAHLSADSVSGGAAKSQHVASNSSRLGIGGSHELTPDTKAVFQFESGVDLTGRGSNDGNGPANGNQLFTAARDSYVGVQGKAGTVLVGKLGGLNQWLYDYNLFGDQVGDLGNIWGGNGLPGRVSGALHYKSPTIGNGNNVSVSYVPEGSNDGEDAYILRAEHDNAGLKMGLSAGSVGTGTATPEHKVTALTASKDFGKFSLGGGFQKESDAGGTAGNDFDSYTLGATAKVSPKGTAKIQYANIEGSGAGTTAKQLALGYDYALSDNASLYVAYAKTDNDTGTNYHVNNWGHGQAAAPGAGNDPSAVSVGFIYNFKTSLLGK